MGNTFIAPSGVYKKLNFARSANSSVYIYGATGFGKTRLTQEYLKSEEAVWLSVSDEEWDLSFLKQKKAKGEKYILVVDDLQDLCDEEQRQILISLSERDDVWLIMLGRMPAAEWMLLMLANGQLIIITEEDLRLSANEMLRIARSEGVSLTRENAELIAKQSNGNAFMIATAMQMIKYGEVLDQNLTDRLSRMFEDHLEQHVISQWNMQLQEFLMQVSVVDAFTLPMAVMITGDNQAAAMIEKAEQVGNFLECEDSVYRIRGFLLQALRRKALKVYGLDKYHRYADNAGLYYAMQNDVEGAIRMYEISGNKAGIRSLLIRNGRRNFGNGKFYELRRYYLALDEKDVKESAVLMAALSMLYSVLMNPEKSEYWYRQLQTDAAIKKGGERREANEWLLYLDISLPHRGTVDMIDILKRASALIRSGGLVMPEVTLTSNMPSIMNGGKDFCSWSKKDQFLADTLGKMIEKLLGPVGRGLIHASLCESFYEKGKQDTAASHLAMLVQMEVEGGGRLELLFATIGIQVRLSMLNGNTRNAIQILDAFEARAVQEKQDMILQNLRALRCRVALMMGHQEMVDAWMEEAPNERSDFWVMERYRYMTKILCYLEDNHNQDAIELLDRMIYYAQVNKRTYIGMESGLLMAIAKRRQRQEWKEELLVTLNEISEYQFIRIISEKGAGILPLLKEVRKDYLGQSGADTTWFNNVMKETTRVAELYPGYLNSEKAQPADFCETAMDVLRMQAGGMSIKEIAGNLNLSERTVKYHAAENYRKLGAKGKTDAVQIAKSMNLI